ncbi:Rieske 2Fe-2S domain-containing protein [Rhizorhabdus dicambivorans]|uniref:(2Fe-2S)-binding protein n=1 Tax=Rhizorhabdus dicambivorans TaxID=1850238 RepID=A0A2A4FVW6_9SPHN|nr:Rieske 2Fe-2S domain-containing protein [Rhizorhabdus dicambivorans]ATE64140.1 (2Fe-2S)-binding protein [Rhizorhabdus dicambivorans]PCE42589.1 (2Fe-2S)-binding protein [Rhizorhabdus dicambivorans]
MLSHNENELICRVGEQTPMGRSLRHYWTPFLQSSDLIEAGGDPRRIELLGQSFVAFRGEDGVIGLLDEGCCHRGASLALGRVEGCGIRCLFHGWKFAADGTLLETPNIADPRFRKRIRARAYPVREAGGLVWAYLGPKEFEPEFPRWNWLKLPAANRVNSLHVLDCNYVQVTEGLVDSAHLSILHADGVARASDLELDYGARVSAMGKDLLPRLEIQDDESGFRYAALRVRDGEPGLRDVRVTQFVAPYSVYNANGDIVTIMVPATDTRTLFFHVFWDEEKPIGEEPLRSRQLDFVGLDRSTLCSFGIALDSPEADRPGWHNGFHQDRAAMRAGRSFTGISGIVEEDAIMAIGSGPIRDRTLENLCPSDLAVAGLYRALLSVARAEPGWIVSAEQDDVVRGWTATLDEGRNWRDMTGPPQQPAPSHLQTA